MIVAAAVHYDGKVYSLPAPARHVDVRMSMSRDGVLRFSAQNAESGFLDDAGRFLRRKAAAQHAWRAGQVTHEKINWNLGLFSEDLW